MVCRYLAFGEHLTTQLNDNGITLWQPDGAAAVFDDVKEGPIKAFLKGNGFMNCPLKLTIHLSSRNKNGQFPQTGVDPGLYRRY